MRILLQPAVTLALQRKVGLKSRGEVRDAMNQVKEHGIHVDAHPYLPDLFRTLERGADLLACMLEGAIPRPPPDPHTAKLDAEDDPLPPPGPAALRPGSLEVAVESAATLGNVADVLLSVLWRLVEAATRPLAVGARPGSLPNETALGRDAALAARRIVARLGNAAHAVSAPERLAFHFALRTLTGILVELEGSLRTPAATLTALTRALHPVLRQFLRSIGSAANAEATGRGDRAALTRADTAAQIPFVPAEKILAELLALSLRYDRRGLGGRHPEPLKIWNRALNRTFGSVVLGLGPMNGLRVTLEAFERFRESRYYNPRTHRLHWEPLAHFFSHAARRLTAHLAAVPFISAAAAAGSGTTNHDHDHDDVNENGNGSGSGDVDAGAMGIAAPAMGPWTALGDSAAVDLMTDRLLECLAKFLSRSLRLMHEAFGRTERVRIAPGIRRRRRDRFVDSWQDLLAFVHRKCVEGSGACAAVFLHRLLAAMVGDLEAIAKDSPDGRFVLRGATAALVKDTVDVRTPNPRLLCWLLASLCIRLVVHTLLAPRPDVLKNIVPYTRPFHFDFSCSVSLSLFLLVQQFVVAARSHWLASRSTDGHPAIASLLGRLLSLVAASSAGLPAIPETRTPIAAEATPWGPSKAQTAEKDLHLCAWALQKLTAIARGLRDGITTIAPAGPAALHALACHAQALLSHVSGPVTDAKARPAATIPALLDGILHRTVQGKGVLEATLGLWAEIGRLASALFAAAPALPGLLAAEGEAVSPGRQNPHVDATLELTWEMITGALVTCLAAQEPRIRAIAQILWRTHICVMSTGLSRTPAFLLSSLERLCHPTANGLRAVVTLPRWISLASGVQLPAEVEDELPAWPEVATPPRTPALFDTLEERNRRPRRIVRARPWWRRRALRAVRKRLLRETAPRKETSVPRAHALVVLSPRRLLQGATARLALRPGGVRAAALRMLRLTRTCRGYVRMGCIAAEGRALRRVQWLRWRWVRRAARRPPRRVWPELRAAAAAEAAAAAAAETAARRSGVTCVGRDFEEMHAYFPLDWIISIPKSTFQNPSENNAAGSPLTLRRPPSPPLTPSPRPPPSSAPRAPHRTPRTSSPPRPSSATASQASTPPWPLRSRGPIMTACGPSRPPPPTRTRPDTARGPDSSPGCMRCTRRPRPRAAGRSRSLRPSTGPRARERHWRWRRPTGHRNPSP